MIKNVLNAKKTLKGAIENPKQAIKNGGKLALNSLGKKAKMAIRTAIGSVVKLIAPILIKILVVVLILVLIIAIFSGIVTFFFSNEMQSTGTLLGDTVQEKVWLALTEAGYSEYATAGVMGNIEGESSFDPTLVEGGYSVENGGIGLVQWTNNGRGNVGGNTGLRNYAKSIGKDWKDEDVQIEFLLADLSGGGCNGYSQRELYNSTSGYYGKSYYITDWENASSPEAAAEAFCAVYERPASWAFHQSMPRRKKAARKYYNEFHGKTRSNFISLGIEQETKGDVDKDGYSQKIMINGVLYTEYKQNSKLWAKEPYWGSNIGKSGCGPTSLAVIASGYGMKYTPKYIVNKKYITNTNYETLQQALKKLGLSYKYQETSKQGMINHLKTGRPLIVSVRATKANFTSGRHIMAILGIKGDKVYVSNVYNSTNLKTGWTDIDDLVNATNYYIKILSEPKKNASNFSFGTTSTSSNMGRLVSAARNIAKDDHYKYVYGTKGPDTFDCSGLVYYLYNKYLGKSVPRSSGGYRKYKGTSKEVKLNINSLKAGDVLWRNGHVGLYIGNGNVVHAANSRTGIVEVKFKDIQRYDPFTNAFRLY